MNEINTSDIALKWFHLHTHLYFTKNL